MDIDLAASSPLADFEVFEGGMQAAGVIIIIITGARVIISLTQLGIM